MEAMKPSCPLVLILDNNPDERVDLYSVLDREGFLVATRSNPLDALKYVSEVKPEVVVVAGPLSATQCRSIVKELHAISPRSHLLVARSDEEIFSLGGLASEPYVTVVRGLAKGLASRGKMIEILRQFTGHFSPPVSALPA